MTTTVETAIYRLQIEGQEKIDRLTKSLDGLSVAEEKAATSTRTMSQALQNQIARADPLIRAQEQYRKALETNARYREAGVGTEAQIAAHLAATTGRYREQVAAITAASGAAMAHVNASKLQRYEMINLGRQLQDVGVSLFSGQSPLTVLVQQGSQIADISVSSGVRMRDMFKQVGGAIGSVITPVNASIAGVVALTAAVAALALQYDKVDVSARRATSGAGARTGTTTGDINAFVDKNTPSSLSGSSLSQKESRALGEGLTKTGDIVISKLNSMSAAVVGFSNQTGQSMDEAVKAFTKMASDPVKAMDELAKAFGAFSQPTRTLVQDMVAAGDKTLAWNAILNELGPTAKGTAGNLTTAEMAVRGLVNALQIAPKPSGLEKQLEDVRQKLNGAIEAAEQFARHGVAAPPEVSNSIVALNKTFEELYARQQAVIGLKISATFNDTAEKARVVTEALIPQIAQLREMETNLNRLQAARDNGSGGPNNDAAITALQNLIAKTREAQAEAARYNQQVAAIAQSWGNVGQAVALQLQAMQNVLPVAQAWTNATRMRAQEEATYLSLIQKGLTAEEASAVAAKEYELSKAAAVASAKQLVQSSEDNLDKIKAMGTGMEGAVDSAIAYRNAIDAGATATQAAAIAANTLEASMLRSAQAAQQMAQSAVDAASGTTNGILTTAGMGSSFFAPTENRQSGAFAITTGPGATYRGGSRGGWDPYGSIVQMMRIEETFAAAAAAFEAQKMSSSDYVNKAISGGVDVAIAGLQSGSALLTDSPTSTLSTLYNLKNQGADTATQIANDQQFLSWLQGQPQTIENLQAISSLTQEIQNLAKSTDGLNQTNQDLLSPYYSQDPRTSHIGFRTQGMATGGEFTVPGGYSANDNMLAQIPVASGEIVQVRRPGQNGGKSQVINITNNIVVGPGVNKDEFGRTAYHQTQAAARQIAAVR